MARDDDKEYVIDTPELEGMDADFDDDDFDVDVKPLDQAADFGDDDVDVDVAPRHSEQSEESQGELPTEEEAEEEPEAEPEEGPEEEGAGLHRGARLGGGAKKRPSGETVC